MVPIITITVLNTIIIIIISIIIIITLPIIEQSVYAIAAAWGVF